MALHLDYFEANALGAYVMDAWQKHLGIEIKPEDKDLVPKKLNKKSGQILPALSGSRSARAVRQVFSAA